MTSPIIYSDLRFSGAAPRSANHRDSTPEDPTEDGDIMYENVISPPPAREKRLPPATPAPAMGRGQQLMSGFRKCSLHFSLVFLLLCLLLSAAVITMTVKYLQKSSDFQTLMTDHQTMSSGMTRSLRSGEDLHKSLRNDLVNTKAELEKTQRELRKLEQDHRDQNNRMMSSLKSTESLLEAANTKLMGTQNDLERIRSELQAEMSKKNNLHNDLQTCRDEQKPTSEELNKCRQSIQDICPEGWELFGKKCLWFSQEEKWWQYSYNDCKSRNSNLLVVENYVEDKVKELIKKKNGSYWVRRKWHTERYWYISFYGNLNTAEYYTNYKWICERNIVLTRADQTCA